MSPNPDNYKVTPEMLRKRMNLSDDTCIVQTGTEHLFGKDANYDLRRCYDKSALLLRTFPDFTLICENQSYFVEAKQTTKSVEAMGLYYNKLRERAGLRVLYSFPKVTINASQIPMEIIEVPLKYRVSFKKHLQEFFVEERCKFNFWGGNPENGSGDPFVRIEEYDLKLLAGDVNGN